MAQVTINLTPQTFGLSGFQAVSVIVRATPWRGGPAVIVDGDEVRLPEPVIAQLPAVALSLAETGDDWCWRITVERGRQVYATRHVTLTGPGPIDWESLTDVDPSTLIPADPENGEAWAAQLIATALDTALSGADITMSATSLPASAEPTVTRTGSGLAPHFEVGIPAWQSAGTLLQIVAWDDDLGAYPPRPVGAPNGGVRWLGPVPPPIAAVDGAGALSLDEWGDTTYAPAETPVLPVSPTFDIATGAWSVPASPVGYYYALNGVTLTVTSGTAPVGVEQVFVAHAKRGYTLASGVGTYKFTRPDTSVVTVLASDGFSGSGEVSGRISDAALGGGAIAWSSTGLTGMLQAKDGTLQLLPSSTSGSAGSADGSVRLEVPYSSHGWLIEFDIVQASTHLPVVTIQSPLLKIEFGIVAGQGRTSVANSVGNFELRARASNAAGAYVGRHKFYLVGRQLTMIQPGFADLTINGDAMDGFVGYNGAVWPAGKVMITPGGTTTWVQFSRDRAATNSSTSPVDNVSISRLGA